jgi:general secretion pathway protein G
MPKRVAHLPLAGGFTLVEILVVLVVVGLISGLALPRLIDLPQRIEANNQRKDLLGQIQNLGYRAYTTGASYTLQGQMVRAAVGDSQAILDIPEGWKVSVEQPLRYAFNGTCGGGEIAILSPQGIEERYRLMPPACKPVATGPAGS